MYSDEELKEKASEVVANFAVTVAESGILENLCQAYYDLHERVLDQLGIPARDLDDETVGRLIFEVLCFGAFLMGNLQAREFIQTASREADPIRLVRFSDFVCARTDQQIDAMRISSLCEIVPVLEMGPAKIRFRRGDQLQMNRRMREYGQFESLPDAGEYFAERAALSLDPDRYMFLKLMTFSIVGTISEMAYGIVHFAFRGADN